MASRLLFALKGVGCLCCCCCWSLVAPTLSSVCANLPPLPAGKRRLGGPVTAPRKALDTWEQRFRELIVYRDRHGNCNVPKSFPENQKLGTWVNTQRNIYAKWAQTKVKERKAARSQRAKLLLLRENPSADEGAEGCKVRKRRTVAPDHRAKLDTLREERFLLLKEARFEFDARQALWDEMCSRLILYRDEYGDANPLLRDKRDPQLGYADIIRLDGALLGNFDLTLTGVRAGFGRRTNESCIETAGFPWTGRQSCRPWDSQCLSQTLRRGTRSPVPLMPSTVVNNTS